MFDCSFVLWSTLRGVPTQAGLTPEPTVSLTQTLNPPRYRQRALAKLKYGSAKSRFLSKNCLGAQTQNHPLPRPDQNVLIHFWVHCYAELYSVFQPSGTVWQNKEGIDLRLKHSHCWYRTRVLYRSYDDVREPVRSSSWCENLSVSRLVGHTIFVFLFPAHRRFIIWGFASFAIIHVRNCPSRKNSLRQSIIGETHILPFNH